jgi:hypothetical protein
VNDLDKEGVVGVGDHDSVGVLRLLGNGAVRVIVSSDLG